MRFDVLDARADAARWSGLVGRLPPERRDIHFLPESGRIYEATYGHVPRLAVLEDGDAFVIQPFVERSLAQLPFLAGRDDARRYRDIANPYGFGGPLASSEGDAAIALLRRFVERFRAWCADREIASEFTSLHPLLGNERALRQAGTDELVLQKEVVFIDLASGRDGLWQGLRKGHRSSIKKAQRCGVRVEKIAGTAEEIACFDRLYRETMRRNEAAERWFFPDGYFANCLALLGPDRVSFHFARIGEALAAACIVIHAFDTAYYHFSGSDPAFYEACPNNLLVYEAALAAMDAGCRRFHLGGGVSSREDDTLFIFKSGFSSLRAPLHVYSRIHDQECYEQLSAMKRDYERTTLGAELASDYFPLYRR
jgi:hypothetical protein